MTGKRCIAKMPGFPRLFGNRGYEKIFGAAATPQSTSSTAPLTQGSFFGGALKLCLYIYCGVPVSKHQNKP